MVCALVICSPQPSVLCPQQPMQSRTETSPQPQFSDAQPSGAGEAQPSGPSAQVSEQPDSGSPSSKLCSRAGSRDAAPRNLQAGGRAGSLHTAACQAQSRRRRHCQSSQRDRASLALAAFKPTSMTTEPSQMTSQTWMGGRCASTQPSALHSQWPAWGQGAGAVRPKQQATLPAHHFSLPLCKARFQVLGYHHRGGAPGQE